MPRGFLLFSSAIALLTMGSLVLAQASQDTRPMTLPSASFESFDQRARAGEPLNVVFLGGSLTWGANASDPQRTSYRALMADDLRRRYPTCPLTFHDAAIGGTGSELAIFRLQRDVLSRKPDLVFLDFTINDDPAGQDQTRLAAYESILRRLISQDIPVLQVLLCVKSQLGDNFAPQTQHRYQDHLKLARAYGTGVGDALTYIQPRLAAGEVQLEQLWPFDPIHPDDPGYRLYFEAVRQGFEQAIAERRVCRVPDQPVFSARFMTWQRICVAEQPLPPGWQRASTYRTSMWFDGLSSRWMDDVAVCRLADRDSARPLQIPFSGSFVGVFGEMDQDGLSFRARVDGQPLTPGKSARTDIFPAHTSTPGRLFYWRILADNLPPGPHLLEIEPVFSDTAKAGELRIESICAAGE